MQSKLRVVIVGAGIAGLSFAAYLRKYPQFSVVVYERRGAKYKESSAAIGLRSNGISIAKQLGISREEIRAVIGTGYRTYNIHEEEMSKSDVSPGPDADGALWFVFRQDLKDALVKKVTSMEGEGEPIKIIQNGHVVKVDPEAGIVELSDGKTIEADLIVGTLGDWL